MRELVAVASLIALAATSTVWPTSVGAVDEEIVGPAPAPGAAAEADAPALDDVLSKGERLFGRHCAECHGIDLSGGNGPRLADNENVGEDGLVVQMMVFGGGFMPAFGRLRAGDMAAIATYVRNTHGNEYGVVTEEDVAAVR